MTTPSDRIAVPTNGHRAPLTTEPPPPEPPADPPTPAEPQPPTAASPKGSRPIEIVDPTSPRITITPGQAAVGFSVIASLIVLLLGRRRGRGR
jgi:hypothetical protein